MANQLKLDKAFLGAAYLQSVTPVDKLALEKAYVAAAYLQSTTPIDKIALEKAYVEAAYMSRPLFSISGDQLIVGNPLPGTWSVTIRATDANGDHFDKTFNIEITD